MTVRKRLKKGFTLVEILIVVVILGILAAIVIPQFTSASETAKSSSLISQLQTIRSQLELYQVQHNGDYPALATIWDQLTQPTNVSGTTDSSDGALDFGPYLQKAPVNPFENSSTVGATAAENQGWVYNASTGAIQASIEGEKATELGLTDTSDIATY